MKEKESKIVSDLQDVFDCNLHRLATKLKAIGGLIQSEAECNSILPKEDFFGVGWIIDDLATELDSISAKGISKCISLMNGEPEEKEAGQEVSHD